MMISRTFKKLIQSTTTKNLFAFSSHDEPTPTKLTKVSEKVYE